MRRWGITADKKMKKLTFLLMVVLCSALFCGCEKNGSGKNPSFSQVEKYLFGTWRAVQTVDENGNKKDDPVEVLYKFEKGSGYHDYMCTVTEAGQIVLNKEKFEIEPMAENVEDDVVIYFDYAYSEQYLITQINSSEMRWQSVTHYDPKTKTEEGYIFKRVE